MPALPVLDSPTKRTTLSMASQKLPEYMLHMLRKRDCIDDDDDDCDDGIDPTVPAAIVIVFLVVVVLVVGWICIRRRRGQKLSPFSSSNGNSKPKPGYGPFGLMTSAWQKLSSGRNGKELQESPSQTWPGQDVSYQVSDLNSNNQGPSTNVLPFVRGRATVYRPHSKTLSQLGPPPAYEEADPDPNSTEAGVRSHSRPRASEQPMASSNAGLTWGRSRSTDQQRRGGSGQVELVEQSEEEEDPFADR